MQARSAAAVIVLLLALLAGCAEDDPVEEANVMGVNAQVGQVLLRSVHVEAPAQTRYQPGQDARVWLTLINSGPRPDALIDVASPAAREVTIAWDDDCDGTYDVVPTLPLEPAEPARRDPTGAVPFDAYYVQLVGLTEQILAGTNVPVTFRFERAGEITIHPFVQPPDVPRVEPSTRCR